MLTKPLDSKRQNINGINLWVVELWVWFLFFFYESIFYKMSKMNKHYFSLKKKVMKVAADKCLGEFCGCIS